MDAKRLAREAEKKQLLQRLGELMVEEQKDEGTFLGVPHFSVIEAAARRWGGELSRTCQERAAAEVAADSPAKAACPGCGEEVSLSTRKRHVASIDGDIELVEAVAHCPSCRRDFFPSACRDGIR